MGAGLGVRRTGGGLPGGHRTETLCGEGGVDQEAVARLEDSRILS